jgi:hypothetical protein
MFLKKCSGGVFFILRRLFYSGRRVQLRQAGGYFYNNQLLIMSPVYARKYFGIASTKLIADGLRAMDQEEDDSNDGSGENGQR